MDKQPFSNDGKTGIKEIDALFDREPLAVVLKKSFEKKLSNVRGNTGSSDLLILPKEELGEDWLKTLGVTSEPIHLVIGTDPEFPEISIMISETNIPEVFLKTQSKLKDRQATVFKSLLIQTEKPTSVI